MPKLSVTIDEQVFEIEASVFPQNESEFSVRVNGELLTVSIPEIEATFAEQEWLVVNGRPYEITFHKDLDWIKAFGGLHRLEWTDGNDMTRVAWPEGLPLTFRSTLEEPLRLQGRWSLVFYVPRGTRKVGGFTTSTTG